MFSYAHALMTFTALARLWPSAVSRYSTVTGTVGYTVRVTRPSRSSPRRVWVSTFWVTPSMRRRSSENRSTSSADSALMTSIVHLSATRPRTWRLGHAALMTFHRQARTGAVSIRYLYHKKVPSSTWEPAPLSLPKQTRTGGLVMRAVMATGPAGQRIELQEVAEPEPKPHEAVVEVAAFSPNRGETFLLEQPRPGWRPGKDVAGIVTRAAADGSGPKVGERVVGHPDQGGWAERVAVATDRLVVVPDTVDLVAAAALPLAGLTALRLLRVAGPAASRRLLLTGASGG